MKPDLDSKAHIATLVAVFYDKLLADPVLAPIFLDVATIDIREHFPRIQAYWEKLLLGEDDYQRHTMNIHRALHSKRALTDAEFDRWLRFFTTTVDENFVGSNAEKAKTIAAHIASNMKTRIVHNSFDTQHHRDCNAMSSDENKGQ